MHQLVMRLTVSSLNRVAIAARMIVSFLGLPIPASDPGSVLDNPKHIEGRNRETQLKHASRDKKNQTQGTMLVAL